MSECLMPRCQAEVFARGMCKGHYRIAYPEELDWVREHIALENNRHHLDEVLARDRHRRKKRKRDESK